MSSPGSSVPERQVSNLEEGGSNPSRGSTFLGCWHYVVLRQELSGGAALAQAVHAAGESAALLGRALPGDTRAVILSATKAEMDALATDLTLEAPSSPRVDALRIITETDGPLAGSQTALAFVTHQREAVRPLVAHLKVWRGK